MKFLIIIYFFIVSSIYAQDTLKVCFLYGSKPKKQFREEEKKWFGGKLGGHVGLGIDTNHILNFLPSGQFHVFSSKTDRHSYFATHQLKNFWQIFSTNSEETKKATFYIPLDHYQKILFDSLKESYLSETPYDYAFFGMRCASSTYEILAQIDVLKKYSKGKTIRKIFYPKRLRKRLFKLSKQNNWKINLSEGTSRRKWEKD